MTILGVILARAGSKRLPNKNTKLLNGKPLIEYTIDAALESGVIDTLVVSTDCDDIEKIAYYKYNFIYLNAMELCPYKDRSGIEKIIIPRPAYLATDNAPSEECILHVMDNVDKHDYVMLLQPTSPLRTPKDIQWFVKMGYDFSANERTNKKNGAFYMTEWDKMYKTRKLDNYLIPSIYYMPEQDSIDIDTQLDFDIAEMLIKKRSKN
jgi:CMP-N-acetylneuraminic acid synthetase